MRITAVFFVFMFCFTILSRAADQAGIAQVTVGRPENRMIAHNIKAAGKVVQNQELAVVTLENQRVKTIYVSEGERVKKGDLLFEIEADLLKEQILEQEQEMEKQELQVKDAKSQKEVSAQQKASQQAQAQEQYSLATQSAGVRLSRAKKALEDAKGELEAFRKKKGISAKDSSVEDSLMKVCEEKAEAYIQAEKELKQLEWRIENAVYIARENAQSGANLTENGTVLTQSADIEVDLLDVTDEKGNDSDMIDGKNGQDAGGEKADTGKNADIVETEPLIEAVPLPSQQEEISTVLPEEDGLDTFYPEDFGAAPPSADDDYPELDIIVEDTYYDGDLSSGDGSGAGEISGDAGGTDNGSGIADDTDNSVGIADGMDDGAGIEGGMDNSGGAAGDADSVGGITGAGNDGAGIEGDMDNGGGAAGDADSVGGITGAGSDGAGIADDMDNSGGIVENTDFIDDILDDADIENGMAGDMDNSGNMSEDTENGDDKTADTDDDEGDTDSGEGGTKDTDSGGDETEDTNIGGDSPEKNGYTAPSKEDLDRIEKSVRDSYSQELKTAQDRVETALKEKNEAASALEEYQEERLAALSAENAVSEKQLIANVKAAQQVYEDAAIAANEAAVTSGRAVQQAGIPSASDSSDRMNEITYEQMELKLEKLKNLKKAKGKIYAPADGLVTKINITTGEKTTDTTAVLMADLSKGFRFVADITKEQEQYIGTGDLVTLTGGNRQKLEELPVESVTVDDEDDSTWHVAVQIPDETLDIGATATLEFTKKSEAYSTCVPLSALHLDEKNQPYVLVPDEYETIMGTELRARKVSVMVLEKNESYAALAEGALTSQQEVIISADKAVDEGSRVRVSS